MTRFIKTRHYYTDTFRDIAIHTGDEAYIRLDHSQAEPLWVIYDTDGTKIGHANSREVAMAVAVQNDFIVFDVH